ncbi:MAG: hypothetical protein JWN70_4391 [Planctomycetaceae bacterium]|nr:hypothetical protein [Planctomycetaceae bacterium]
MTTLGQPPPTGGHDEYQAVQPDIVPRADCGVDSALRLWDCELGQEILRMHHDSTIFDLTFRPDGRQIASASRDGTARIWDASDP